MATSSSATFAFTSNEAGVIFECSLDGAAFTSCTSPRSYLSLADGTHTFQVRAKDAFSVDPTPASHTWTVDTAAPNTFLTATPPATSTSPQASFSFSSDAGATFECSLDGTGFAACTSPYTSASLQDGNHTFSVRARDAAGNVDATPASFSWTVDAGPPDTTLTSKPPALTNATSATFAFTSNEAGATFECSLDGAAFTACTSPVNYSALGMGSHTFVVRAKDGSGQRDASPPTHLWSIDSTAPDTTLTSVPPVLSNTTSASFVFASSESSVTFECSLDGVAFSPCTSPSTHASLPEGAHTFQVRARDGAGNVDISPASHTWTVDTVAPAAPVLAAPARGATVTTAFPELSGTAEPGSTVSVSIDGSAVGTAQADSAGNWLLTPPAPLGEGQHGISLSAKDKAGNTSTAANSLFTVKTTGSGEPEPEQPGGCGCSSTAPLSAWPWAVLVLGLALSRRRASGGGAS
jgi:MYXO-CTERM domain-containing protein